VVKASFNCIVLPWPAAHRVNPNGARGSAGSALGCVKLFPTASIRGFIRGHFGANLETRMTFSKAELWDRFKRYYFDFPAIGLSIDLSRMNVSDEFMASMEPRVQQAFRSMAALEKGAIANPDENRMVGHYWLRAPELAPTPAIRAEIEQTTAAIKAFAAEVHTGSVQGAGGSFKNLLVIGIGGSALGPLFVSHALGDPAADKLRFFLFDNTDPDGMARTLAEIGNSLNQTICIVISKSGGTKETRNGMLEAKAAYEAAGLDFGKHAVAVTQSGSELDKVAIAGKWIRRFPMWDWVGGRTSELSAVGLLPAALQGIDITELLAGARACDQATRAAITRANPAALLALAWFESGNGNGCKNMVILPYKDRLELLSKYLQQLIMESLGKAQSLDGKIVHQGICVFGNKGSTDQHSYIQQLRDGINNFFATFIQVRQDLSETRKSIPVEGEDITSGDFLFGFLHGTRTALSESGRESLTITVGAVSPFTVGVLIALFERVVGFYASLVNVNAYHQPGVEAGKKAASGIIEAEKKVIATLKEKVGVAFNLETLAMETKIDSREILFEICERLAANPDKRVSRIAGSGPFDASYRRS
jgi:glucose-6-phosphate isomerase